VRRLFHVAVVVVSTGLLASAAAALPYTSLVVFGDSIVDAGNTHDLALAFAQPDPTPAGAGYFDGRFTNGINPADVVNLAISGVNSDNSLDGGTNYAFGGARARNNADVLPDLAAQVTQYSTAVGGVANPNALYMINVGGNDVFDILNGGNQTTITNAAVAAITTSITTLQTMGAQNILFVGVGDVGSPPASNGAEAVGRNISIALNTAIQAALPGGVQYFNTIALTDAIAANPALYGLPPGLLTEVSCLNGGGAPPGGPPTCNSYAFFDNVHPTTQVLQVLGNAIVSVVPEPGTGLLLSLGLVALAVRRRVANA